MAVNARFATVEPHLPDVVPAIEHSRTPFLFVTHGNVQGGGFETAMGSAWRTARRAPGSDCLRSMSD